MKRKIIEINEEKCNGCGQCINICAEAALELVDGKAKVVKDFYCDGMGACLDVCPVDALKIVEKEGEEYSVEKTYDHVLKTRGEDATKDIHGIENIEKEVGGKSMQCGCFGSMERDRRDEPVLNDKKIEPSVGIKSELRQWPIQLHLLSPAAPFFEGADLVIAADCVPFSYSNFHNKFLRDKILIMFCPKLDVRQEEYLEKLTEIFKHRNIKAITLVHMEVPCCGGVGQLLEKALMASGKNIVIRDYTISIEGEIV